MSVFCDPALNILITENVNDSQPLNVVPGVSNGFALAQPNIVQSCLNNVNDAFETFCTLPGNNVLDTNTCNIDVQTGQPDALFERLVRGEIQHPDNMLAIWESAFFQIPPSNSVPWVTVVENVMHTNVSAPDNYLGFQAVDNDKCEDVAVSNGSNVILVVEAGQAFQNESDGLMHSLPSVIGVGGSIDTCAVSSSGRIRAVCFTNALYFFMNNVWQSRSVAPVNIQYQTLRMWELSPNIIRVAVFSIIPFTSWSLDVYEFKDVTNNPVSSLDPVITFGQLTSVVPTFVFITPDNQALLCATIPSDHFPTMNIHQFDAVTLTNPPQYSKFSFSNLALGRFVEVTLRPFRAECVSQGSLASSLPIYAVLGGSLQIQCTLMANGSLTNLNVVDQPFQIQMRARDNISHTKILTVFNSSLFANTLLQSPLIIPNQSTAFPLNDVTTPYVWAISPDGLDIWVFRNGQLFRLPNPSSTTFGNAWVFTFNLYLSSLIQVSDFGLPSLDRKIYVPGMQWFLGTVTIGKDLPIQTTFPVEAARSRHQNFRYELQTPKRDMQPLVTFTYASANLQRANEYGLAIQSATVRLFNDSNVVMSAAEGTVLWESHTNDQVSRNPTESQTLEVKEAPFATTSPNGLYLLYVSSVKNRLRLVNNSFNCGRFTKWCAQDSGRIDRGLNMQTELCWNALKVPTPGSTAFADQRCTCIGGPRLFNIIAPQADQVPQGLLGPIEENLPCIANGCATSIEDDQDPTNVRTYFQQRCNGRIFNICQQVLDIGVDTKLVDVDFLRLQNCTTNQFTNCKEDTDCGPGMQCFNGACVATCHNNHQCQQFSGNTFNMQCLEGRCQKVVQKETVLSTQWIVAIVLGAILLIMLITFVVLLAKRHNATKKQQVPISMAAR